MTPEFLGKVVLITGASSGIGKTTALAFAREGAKVVVTSRRITEGEETAHQICEGGGEAIFIQTDVSQAGEVEAMVNKTVKTYGRLDCAFNNAGVVAVGALIELSEQEWDYTVNTNLKGVWLSLKYEIPQMLKQGSGAIVNMSSLSGMVGKAGSSIYSASKGGAIALTKAAAIEYAGSNIRINAISPAVVKTGMLSQIPPEQLAQIEAEHPIGRAGQPEEVAEAVLWLCSDRASFVTGHNLVIDGGYTAQ